MEVNGLNALAEIEDVRTVAKRLGVPYLFVQFAVNEHSSGTITPADVTEYTRWMAVQP